MLESFMTVGIQVLTLFILIMTGFFCGKTGILDQGSIRRINDLVLYIVNPCVIVNAFQRSFDEKLLKGFLLAALSAVIGHAICMLLSFILLRDHDEGKKKVMRFAAIFSNCGFMALPLLDALLGADGVFYGAAYLAVFNLLVWSYGQYTMARGSEGFSAKKIVLNPGVIAVIVGLLFFFTSVRLPVIVALPVEYLAALNTPLPMIIIGFTISTLSREMLSVKFADVKVYLIRLIVSPLILLGILYAIGFRGTLLVSCIVSASAPTAALTTMFSIKFGCDSELSARLVAISTLFSIITMTLIVGFAQYIA